MSEYTDPLLERFDTVTAAINRLIAAVENADIDSAQDELRTVQYRWPLFVDLHHLIRECAPVFHAVREHNAGGYGGLPTKPIEDVLTPEVIEASERILQLRLWADVD